MWPYQRSEQARLPVASGHQLCDTTGGPSSYEEPFELKVLIASDNIQSLVPIINCKCKSIYFPFLNGKSLVLNLNRLCYRTKRRGLTSIKSANYKSLVFRGRSIALNINHRFLVKFSIIKYLALPPGASLMVWMLTMLKRGHLSELSISGFPTPKRGWSLDCLWDFSLLGSGVCSVVFLLCSKPRNR